MDFAIDRFDRERFGLVTGSKCSVLFTKKGVDGKGLDTYARQLANAMFFQTYDEVSTWQMEHGQMAESFAHQHYIDYVDDRIEKGHWIRKDKCGGNPDAKIPGVRGVDYKCPTTLSKWLDYLYFGIDHQQECQARFYMYLENLPKWEIAAYLCETSFMSNNGLTYPVPEHQRMIRIEVERDIKWETSLEIVVPSVIEVRDKYLKILEERFGVLQCITKDDLRHL
jgi:hypothetical protein